MFLFSEKWRTCAQIESRTGGSEWEFRPGSLISTVHVYNTVWADAPNCSVLPQTSSLIQQLSKKIGGVFFPQLSVVNLCGLHVCELFHLVWDVSHRWKGWETAWQTLRCGRGCRNESRADDVFCGSAELWLTRPDRVARQQLLLKAHSFHIWQNRKHDAV